MLAKEQIDKKIRSAIQGTELQQYTSYLSNLSIKTDKYVRYIKYDCNNIDMKKEYYNDIDILCVIINDIINEHVWGEAWRKFGGRELEIDEEVNNFMANLEKELTLKMPQWYQDYTKNVTYWSDIGKTSKLFESEEYKRWLNS